MEPVLTHHCVEGINLLLYPETAGRGDYFMNDRVRTLRSITYSWGGCSIPGTPVGSAGL